MRLALLFPLLVSVTPVCAQSVAGAWYTDDEDGRTRLVLQVDGAGNVTGSLAGPAGYTMRVQGKASGDRAECKAQLESDPTMSFGFRARAEREGLVLELLDPDSGQPMEQIQFHRDGNAPAPGPAPGPGPAPQPPSQLATFAGEFEGDGLKVTLRAAGDAWEGQIESDGRTMACKARGSGDQKIAGSFEAEGTAFGFEASLAGETLTLVSDGATYRLKRTAGGAAPAVPAPSGGEKAKHPAGVEVDLPRGWTSNARERGVLLLPPGVRADDPNAAEGHLFVAEAVKDPAITSPDHQAVVQQMDQLVQLLFPGTRRAAAPTLEKGPRGPIALMTWTGQVQAGPVEVRAWVAIVEGVGVALVSAASPEQMKTRAPEVRGAANTFRRCEGAPAGEIAGKWVLNGFWRGGQNRFQGDSQTVVRLNPDGSASYFYLSYVSSPAGIVENKEEKSGRWTAQGGVLTLTWQDGSSERSRYQLNGNQLTTEDDGSRRVWQRGN